MPAFILATIAALAAAVHAAPAHAQTQLPFQLFRSNALPDAVEFGSRIENNDLEAAKDWLDRGLDPDFVGDRIGTGLVSIIRLVVTPPSPPKAPTSTA